MNTITKGLKLVGKGLATLNEVGHSEMVKEINAQRVEEKREMALWDLEEKLEDLLK